MKTTTATAWAILALLFCACPRQPGNEEPVGTVPPDKPAVLEAPAYPIQTNPPLYEAIMKATGKTRGFTCEEIAEVTRLDLAGSSLSSLDGIQCAAGVLKLDLSSNMVNDLAPLAGLSKITELDLSRNYIERIEPLSSLTTLQILNISDNMVRDLGPIAGLVGLEKFMAANNQVSDLTPLSNLDNLAYLDLAHNRIVHILPLAQNADRGGIGQGAVIILVDNPLDSDALFAHVPALKSKGMEVITGK